MLDSNAYIRICRNGHLKQVGTVPEFAELHNHSLPDNVVSQGDDYCEKCGGEVIYQCDNCTEYIPVDEDWDAKFNDLPRFCRGCGESYPWVNPVAANEERDGRFVQINDEELGGQFYPGLVYEINLCYRVQADEACVVLSRKLIENLLLDILKRRYGMQEVHIFYDTEHGKHRGFGHLIEEFGKRSEEFDQYTTASQDDIKQLMKSVKYSGDASAHSIEEGFSSEELEELSEKATRAAELLFRLKREVEVSHRK
ncbi:DUF2321 domain-containing protein [Haloarcula rubripromontorii]|uniref:DUF2321 domain-containing protein n=1 Tax=Haloarcula rubripromontorii TaxID=1705562 RepID=UPI00345B95FB